MGDPGAFPRFGQPDRSPSGGETGQLSVASRLPAILVWLLIAAYVGYFGTLTVLKHDAFQTTAFDLGNVDQAVWNTAHGRPLAMTNIEGLTNRLGTHVEPILLPISLVYLLWSDPRALLLLQTVVIALGAWPVYLLAKRTTDDGRPQGAMDDGLAGSTPTGTARNRPEREAVGGPSSVVRGWSSVVGRLLPVVFSFSYLMFPALQSANVFDFHAVSLAPTFFLFALYCLETRRWAGLAAFAVLTMSTKEDMPLLVVMLGLYALVTSRGRLWRVGVLTMAAGVAWFAVAVGVVMPHLDTAAVSPFANRYQWLGDGPAEMAKTLVTRPGTVAAHVLTAGNLAYVRDWLAPVAFLGVLAPAVLLMAAPVLAVNLLSSDGFMHQLEGFHYGAPLAPIAVVAAGYGAGWLMRRFARGHGARAWQAIVAVAVLAATLIYHYGHGYTPLAAGALSDWPRVTEHDRVGAAMARRIPAGASLAALPYLNPHASQREQLSMIDRVENGRPEPLHDADYVWLDVTNGWPLHPNDLKAGVDALLAGGYGVAAATDGYLLLERGASRTALPGEFYSFAVATDAAPRYPARLQFMLDGRPALECLGFDLDWQEDGVVATFYWRALEALPPGLHLYPFYVDDATGRVLEDTTLRPLIATTWYPPERWPVGVTLKTSTLPWPVGPEFSLGLGVVRGDDWTARERRLPIRVESSAHIVRLFEGDTWARLLHAAGGRPVPEPRSFSPPSPQQPLAADFGPVRLLGADLSAKDGWPITLYWQARERMDTGYTVFVQLIDAEGRVRSQADAVPRGGGYPTFWWLPGEVVADPVTVRLAGDAGDGPYRLIAGLYDPATGARLIDQATGLDFAELSKSWYNK